MILSAATSRWQTVIADLSLILFLVAASALEEDASVPSAAAAQTAEDQAADIALTVWSDVPGAPSLPVWLAEQQADDSQRLSITVTYETGRLAAALARISTLQQESGNAAENARIEVRQGPVAQILVRLVQDDAAPATGPDIAL